MVRLGRSKSRNEAHTHTERNKGGRSVLERAKSPKTSAKVKNAVKTEEMKMVVSSVAHCGNSVVI